MNDSDEIGVFLGLDVGKSAHHGNGLTPAGKKVFDKQLPNTEPKLRQVFDKLREKFGTVLVIVDQRRLPGESELTAGIAASSALRATFRQSALRIDHALVQSDHSSGRGCAPSGPGQDESAPGHHGARGDDAAGVAEDLAVEAAALHAPRVAQDQRPVGGER